MPPCSLTGWVRHASSCSDPGSIPRSPRACLLHCCWCWCWRSPGTPRITWRAPTRRSLCRLRLAVKRSPSTMRGPSRTVQLLALVATLGSAAARAMRRLPELVQLAAAAIFLYGLAAESLQTTSSRLHLRAAGTAQRWPRVARRVWPSALAIVGTIICVRSSYAAARQLVPWIIGGGASGRLPLAFAIGAWGWRLSPSTTLAQVWGLDRVS